MPEAILDRRLVKKGSEAIPQVLIKWSKFPAAAATWEDLYVVKARFPDAAAWGQDSSGGGGTCHDSSVTNRMVVLRLHVYFAYLLDSVVEPCVAEWWALRGWSV